MVVITVILAVIIGSYVFGMGSSMKKSYVVALTIDRGSDGNVYIMNIGGPDVGKLDTSTGAAMAVTIHSNSPGDAGVIIHSGDVKDLNNAGGTLVLSVTAPSVHVIITATFRDGTQQVISTADV